MGVCQSQHLARGKPEVGPVRTDQENDEGKRTEQRDGIVVPPQLLCVPRKAPVGGDQGRYNE